MREISLSNSIRSIRSGKQKDRQQGLTDFEHLLKERSQNSKFDQLSDKDYEEVFDALFRMIELESNLTSSTSDKLLTRCSYAIRSLLESHAPALEYQTVVHTVLNPILASCGDDDEYLEPVLDNFFKALHAVLAHRPHTEHLTGDLWENLADFCCDSLRHVKRGTVDLSQSSQLVVSTRSGLRLKQASRAGTPAQSFDGGSVQKGPTKVTDVPLSNRRSEELVTCLEYLLKATHVDVLRKTELVLSALFDTLRSTLKDPLNTLQQSCFSSINVILLKALTEDLRLAKSTFTSAVYCIRRLWQGKIFSTPGLRDQMLITLMLGRRLLPSILDSNLDRDETLSDFVGLYDRLHSEYQSRTMDHMLETSHIGLDLSSSDQMNAPFAYATFFIRHTDATPEASWLQLSIMADMFHRLKIVPYYKQLRNERDGLASKRAKYESPLSSLVRSVTTSQREHQLFSLQLLTHVIALSPIRRPDDYQMILESLFPLISKDVGQVSSWAMLSLSLMCRHKLPDLSFLLDVTWLQILQVSITKLSSSRNSRFACHLADSILNHDLVAFSDSVDSMDALLTAVDVSGPSTLSDTAISLWRTVLALYGFHRAASYESVSSNVLRWLFGVWRPSQLNLRSAEAADAHAVSVSKVLALLQVLVGDQNRSIEKGQRRTLSALARAKEICDEDSRSMDFIGISQRPPEEQLHDPEDIVLKRIEPQLSERAKRTALITACDYLTSQVEHFLSTQSGSIATEKLSQLNLRNSLALCVVSFGVAEILTKVDLSRSNQLLNLTIELRDQSVRSFYHDDISRSELSSLCDTLYDVFRHLRLLPLSSFRELSCYSLAIVRTARAFGDDFWRHIQATNMADEDLLDQDTHNDSQPAKVSGAMSLRPSSTFAQDWLEAYSDARACVNSIRAEVSLAASLPDPDSLSAEEAKTLPQKVVDHLLSLDAWDFLACRPFLDDLYASKIEISAEDGSKLLAYLGTQIFESEDLERNETAVATCLDLLGHLVNYWAAADMETDVSHAANQLYTFLMKAASKKKMRSDHIQVRMARMLQRVVKKSAGHGRTGLQPSARTYLLKILETGSVKVRYKISTNIAAIFGFFLLRDHDVILDDIDASIPHDPESLEATAVRLSLLSQLACSWSTLIRRCVYAIVDATGLMPEVAPYAHACLQNLCTGLGMSGLRDLFKLFVPQILYTWLETRTVEYLPYEIFEYSSLKELVLDVKHEIASQIVMRGKEEEVEAVSSLAGMEFRDLLEESFGKCAAYCIARDTAVAPEADPKAADAARRLRQHLGRDEYSRLIASRFPEIVATFFKSLDREDQITKSFHKNPSHAAAQEAFEQMITAGASQNTPPVSQQPSFKSNCLIDELEYICQRSPYDSRQLWTPSLYVYVFRSLLETIHPALGQLHAAAVVRRIRILVSMAGKVALAGYPLEMTLGSLRVHLNNTHSAEDVMGLYRYLLRVGENYLSRHVSFLTGFVVSVLVSLKALAEKPQESTTQESAFQATLTRAHDFHDWITDYASTMDMPEASSDSHQSFREMVLAASNLRARGSSSKDSAEGDLLLRLLHDDACGRQLIDEVSRKAIVTLLCRDFTYAADYRDDILADGSAAALHAPAALELFGLNDLNLSFNLWILRVLGRAYAARGHIEMPFRREIRARQELQEGSIDEVSLHKMSASAIVKLLYQVACAHAPAEAGVAERTVQALLSKAVINPELKEVTAAIPSQALPAMDWQIFTSPPQSVQARFTTSLQDALTLRDGASFEVWCRQVCLALIHSAENDFFLLDLRAAVETIASFAVQAFPYILHLVLLRESGKQEQVKKVMSTALRQMMGEYSPNTRTHLQHLINTLVYLRTQRLPYEDTKSDRTRWLDVDYRLAAEVAVQCNMYKTSLLFVETALSHESVIKGSRRSSAATKVDVPVEMLLSIFQNIEEKDYYYGVRQPTSLASMMERLDMEQAGFRSLSFRGTAFDVESKRNHSDKSSVNALIKTLNNLELSGLSHAIAGSAGHSAELSSEATFDAARKLEKWDIPCPDITSSAATTLFKAYQTVQSANERVDVNTNIDARLENMLLPMQSSLSASSTTPTYWSTLASLMEFDQVLSVKGPQQLQEAWEELESRGDWLRSANSDHIERILSSRETLFSIINKKTNLQQLIRSPPKQTRLVQVKSLLLSSKIHRSQGKLQKSLASTTAIEHLLPECNDLGLRVEAAARMEVSNVLWDSGEMASSIRILQDVSQAVDFSKQDISVSRPELLAKLAQRVSEARLEQPEEILTRYLEPAVKDLRGALSGDVAGRVFHEFASFCDQQLQNTESIEDFQRAQKLRDDKADEIRELDQMIKAAASGSRERENLKQYRTKSKQWYDLDNAEFKRLQNSRDTLLKQSLENYLKCLKACDNFDRDAIRFSALWLEHHDEDVANEVVGSYIGEVSSRKFATLMNQWTSRLLDEDHAFQTLLADIIYRICADHPYHGMYNIFASSRSKGGKDQSAMSRHAAANAVVSRLRADKEINSRWLALHNSCVQYVRFASEKADDGKYRQGAKILLEKSVNGVKLQEVINMKVPPATMKVELRKDCNYKNVPVIVKWSREFSIASGISAPKITTATASNGQKFKQLFKAGNDDLRQDAIMEQVFEQVSELLVDHRETRQRKLGIRSYKVLPLTSGAGIIEFVANTIPINDYLVPAHAEHYPNDLKASAARKIIYEAAASRRNDHRVMEFRRVCERLHPVLRYFFMERFDNPDDWFEKRLNYTRTTAAISMLGHILGLGDRHGHNILLDEKTGEVVHIDLGIAFEQGRILPVPELVPFRLTRDIVDGFGVTKTEGVFRRCCEFTLDALRRESYSIMTILDVLRYDPLYSWSLSPLRLKRLQEDKLDDDEDRSAINGGVPGSDNKADKKENEEAEADRALTVVAKKLSKGLSVEATVNELIQQASDERNLALLFAGWAAYI